MIYLNWLTFYFNFCSVSVSLSRHMGASGVNDYIDKSLLVATPIYKSADSIILDGLTGTCTALSASKNSVAAASDRSTAIKIFQIDREWGEMMKKSKVFIYRNPSYLEGKFFEVFQIETLENETSQALSLEHKKWFSGYTTVQKTWKS